MGTHKAPQEVLRSLKAAGGMWITAGYSSLHHILSQTNQKLKQQEEIVCFGSREVKIKRIVAVTNEWRQKGHKGKNVTQTVPHFQLEHRVLCSAAQ